MVCPSFSDGMWFRRRRRGGLGCEDRSQRFGKVGVFERIPQSQCLGGPHPLPGRYYASDFAQDELEHRVGRSKRQIDPPRSVWFTEYLRKGPREFGVRDRVR